MSFISVLRDSHFHASDGKAAAAQLRDGKEVAVRKGELREDQLPTALPCSTVLRSFLTTIELESG